MFSDTVLDSISATDYSTSQRIEYVKSIYKFQIIIDIGQAIDVEVDLTEGNRWVATTPIITVHGVGDTPREAANELRSMIFDYYKELLESEELLAPHLKNELDYLNNIFT
jgi:predicted RNase H-like HicB family nuclease